MWEREYDACVKSLCFSLKKNVFHPRVEHRRPSVFWPHLDISFSSMVLGKTYVKG